MRHLSGYRKLGKNTSHRRAMLRNMATSLFLHERIETTIPRAKELKSIVEKLITAGKTNTLHARRMVSSYCFDQDAVKKIFDTFAERYKTRPGGYTRIFRKGIRFGDGAQRAILELVDREGPAKEASGKEVPAVAKTEKKASKAKAAQ
ncbi:MAG: 50S ribosomal protein L17 [Oligoflexales bacterium]|nr:50S ribosomal protein L17 [Oligoflexales bacterium]